MPNTMIRNFAKESGKTVDEVEKLWSKAKAIAKESGHEEEYDYIVGILKKMLSLNEETAAADLGPAPEATLFKGPKRREQCMDKKGKCKLRSFKQIALDVSTDTFIKEKGKCKK